MNLEEFMTFNDNYYPNNFGYHTKRATCLFEYDSKYNGIPWKFAKTVSNDDKISFLQIIFALSEILGKHLYQSIMPVIESIKDLDDILQKDEIGRQYILYADYKKYAMEHKKLFKLQGIKKKEVDLWLLRL